MFKHPSRVRSLIFLIFMCAISMLLAIKLPRPTRPALQPAPQHSQAYGQLPLYFIENRGQVVDRIAYYLQGADKAIGFTREGLTFILNEKPALAPASFKPSATTHPSRWGLKLDFIGANSDVEPVGEAPTEAVISYFKGQPSSWHSALKTY